MAEASTAVSGEMLLKIYLKRRQTMNLSEINRKLEATGFWQKFRRTESRWCPGP